MSGWLDKRRDADRFDHLDIAPIVAAVFSFPWPSCRPS
jgi:hypothetical protein